MKSKPYCPHDREDDDRAGSPGAGLRATGPGRQSGSALEPAWATSCTVFYPKADTPGCTTQACGIRDHRADYDAVGATVLGVSPDPVKAVKKFHDKQGLGFTLLADSAHAVAEQYGVWVEKSMYGRTYMGNARATFLIDEEGVVRHVIPKASPKTHDDEVLAALGTLAAA